MEINLSTRLLLEVKTEIVKSLLVSVGHLTYWHIFKVRATFKSSMVLFCEKLVIFIPVVRNTNKYKHLRKPFFILNRFFKLQYKVVSI
jgi:hypothetical protein